MIGGMAAGRPLLSGIVIAFAAAALVSVSYRQAPASFADASFSYLAALSFLAVAPPAFAAIAPRNFWLRAIYAGILAGLYLAGRRLMLQSGVSFGLFDANLALVVAAISTFALALGAPLWRSAIALSLVGLSSTAIGAAAGLAIVSLQTARSGPVPLAGAALALGAAVGVTLTVQMASAYSRIFAEGADNYAAAAGAAKAGVAPALFALMVGVAAVALCAFSPGQAESDFKATIWVGAGSLAFAAAGALFYLPGSLALKAQSELAAVAENRRRAALRPLLTGVRNFLPPSSAMAASAIFLIIAVAAAFESKTPAGAGEIALISVVALMAAVSFVSLRTALMAALFIAAAGRIAVWGIEIAGFAPPSETARIIAAAVAALLTAQLFIAWRDNRNPRRKTREVVRIALADSFFAYVASSIIAASVLAASEVGGIWNDGIEAGFFSAYLAAIGAVAAPPLMTAVGALFGRN
jgi:hypothetical protein